MKETFVATWNGKKWDKIISYQASPNDISSESCTKYPGMDSNTEISLWQIQQNIHAHSSPQCT